MKLYDALDVLCTTHRHQDLWLRPGCSAEDIKTIALSPEEWPAPVILTQNNHIVAERTASPDVWTLVGNFMKPAVSNVAATPDAAFKIDPYYRFLFTYIL